MAFDGANMWVANYKRYVTKIRASDGTVLGPTLRRPVPGVVFDSANIWVTAGT